MLNCSNEVKNNLELVNWQKIMRKTHDRKKKTTGIISPYLQHLEKHQKAIMKMGLTVNIPKTPSLVFSSRNYPENIHSLPLTPNCNYITKQFKENSILLSTNPSHTSSPFDFQSTQSIQQKPRSRNDYKFLYQVGSGGFGCVWKVSDKRTGQILAMKEISKAKVILKKSVASVLNQKILLESMSSKFIINMKHAFQDRQFLYLSMEYLRGGDLRYHLCFHEFFTEIQAKFIAGCIVLGLQYIHSKGVIHRDLKPQNLVFEEGGYLRITDFGVARKKRQNNGQQTSGTPGYMAPQVICRMSHGYEADYFALGVIIYEIIFGFRPYMGDTRKQIREKILAHQAKISQRQLPHGWSKECMDFVNKLLKRNKQSRLGYNSIEELKNHPWFASISWKRLAQKQLTPPFNPGIVTQSAEYQRQIQTSQSSEDQESEMLVRTAEIQNLFKDYGDGAKKQKKRR